MFIHLLDDMFTNSKICIYGTGKRGLVLKEYLKKYRPDIKIMSFIDSYKNNEFIDELEVLNINVFEDNNIQYDFIIIASVFWQEIQKELNKRNLLNYKILGFHFTACMENIMESRISHTTFEGNRIQKCESDLEEIIKNLDTEQDRKIYKKMYDIRAGKINIEILRQEFQKNTDKMFYQYLDYINRDEIKTIIDCGVFDASGIDLFLRYLNKIEKLYGFEPLNDIFCPEIQNFLPKDKSDKITIIPKALFTHKTRLNISISNTSSTLTKEFAENTRLIDTISIDEFVDENKIARVDFIKLDIENAELPALKGAQKTIEKHRPQIATAIYHSHEQFFEVPLLLIKNLENYTHKIAHYSLGFEETVWYAIPNEKILK